MCILEPVFFTVCRISSWALFVEPRIMITEDKTDIEFVTVLLF